MAASAADDTTASSGSNGVQGAAVPAVATSVQQALGGRSGGKGNTAKSATNKARKPRAAKDVAAAAKPSRTLDMWFKPTSKAAVTRDGDKKRNDDNDPAEKAADAPLAAPTKPKATPSSAKKLVQRRIHITDVCRVCDSARTDDVSRCELRCIGCDMTVHKKCYGVKDDPPDRTWHCRRCQFALDQKNPGADSGEGDSDASEDASEREESAAALGDAEAPDLANTTFPTHDALSESHKYAALHRDPNFPTAFRFLQRFRHLGLRVPADLSLHNLATALVSPQESRFCEDLHSKLLTTVEAPLNKNYSWSGNMLRFLDSDDLDTATLKGCEALAGCNKTSDDRRDDAVYWSLPVRERVAVLKFLCELQFDQNDKLVERIDDEDADAMRDDPVGNDASGRAYYVLEDVGTIPNAAAWVCRCAAGDGSGWETLCDDLESLESLVRSLSLSADTSDLQLWQALSGGVLKKLARRRKKDQLAKTRLARMPRLLDSAGLDASSIISEGVGGSGRSLRSRRQVNYRQLFAEDEQEDEEEEEEEEESNGDQQGDQGEEAAPRRPPRRGKRAFDSGAKRNSSESDSAASEDEDEEDDDDQDDESMGSDDGDRAATRSRRRADPDPSRRSKRAAPSPPARRSKRLRGSESSSP